MALKLKDMMGEANETVDRIDGATARDMVELGALLLDVRDAPELEKNGRAVRSHHIPRGMLEFRADPDSPYAHPEFRRDRPVVLFCASGGRAAVSYRLFFSLVK